MLNKLTVLIVAGFGLFCPVVLFAQDSDNVVPAIDGVFDEWNDDHVIARDLKPGSRDSLPIKSVSAVAYGADLYIKVEFDQQINLQGGNPNEKSTQLQFRDFKIDFNDRKIQKGSRYLTWADVDFEVLPTYASKVFEMKIRGWKDVADKNNAREFSFDVAGGRAMKEKPSAKGSLSPVVYECPERNESGFRIVSQNTLRRGMPKISINCIITICFKSGPRVVLLKRLGSCVTKGPVFPGTSLW